jgi:hypothetical protein
LSIATTPFEPDEVEILATSIGSNTLVGHSYFGNPTISFRPYPEHKTASEPATGLPVVTFTRYFAFSRKEGKIDNCSGIKDRTNLLQWVESNPSNIPICLTDILFAT